MSFVPAVRCKFCSMPILRVPKRELFMHVACPTCGCIAQYSWQEVRPHFEHDASKLDKAWIRVTRIPDKAGLVFYALVRADIPCGSFVDLYTSGFFLISDTLVNPLLPETR
jgi:hypothetical protein